MADEPFLGSPREHATATLAIRELYFTTQKESDPTPDPCNCPCACRDDVEVDLQTGSFELFDASGVVQYESADQNSERPTFILKLNLPDGKAIPTQVLITANIIEADNTSTGRLGRRQVADGQVYSAVVAIDATNFTETTAGDRFVLISIQPDLSQALDKIPAANRAGLNQGVVNLEILAHPLSFKPLAPNASTPLTAHKYSGWFGIHSHFLTDRSRSGISPGNAPGQILSGVDRAAPNASILVPQTSGAGAASGAVQAESGLAYFRADGSAAWFKGKTTSPPNTLSTIAGNTITKRDGSKRVFDSVGNMVQSIDPQGNITTFAYSNSRVTGITDPLGRQTTIAYPSSSATDNRFTITRPNLEVSSFSYNQSTGVQTVTHTDPDGAGPRQSLVEVWTFSDGLLRSRVQRAANGSGESRTTSFTYDFNSAGVGQVRGTRRLKSFTRPDGGTTIIDRAQLNEGLIVNGADLSVSQLLSFDVAPRKSYRNETIITDPRGGITIYTLGASGHLLGMIDPEQVARLYPGQLASTIAASTPATALATLRDQLSYRFDIAAPTRDAFGNITGQYLGLPTQTVTPDPDLVVNGANTVSNGPRGRQTTVLAYTNGNLTSQTRPTLPTQVSQFNELFDIPTRVVDEFGIPTVQTVDGFGLVTRQQKVQSGSAWTNLVDRYDVSADGILTSLDSLLIINFNSANGVSVPVDPNTQPPGGRYYDVNGDGFVTNVDSLIVINELSRRTRNGNVNTFPSGLIDRSFVYTTDADGLPRGLVKQERVATGRPGAASEIITTYEYVNSTNTPGATASQRGKLRRTIVAPGTADEAITSYGYDIRGNLTSITDPLGRVTTFYYDALNRITATLGPDPDETGPLLGPATRFDYDVFGNVIATETINSFLEGGVLYVTATKTDTTYNPVDLPTMHYTQNPDVTWYLSGTALAQGTTKIAGSAITSLVLQSYLAGNSVIVNRPRNATSNQGLVTTFTYNGAGDMRTVTETPTGTSNAPRTTTFNYDKLGRQTEVITPDPGTGLTTTSTDIRRDGGYLTAFAYDNIGNLLSTTDPLGNITSQTYDDLNRVASQTLPNPTISGAAGPTTTYDYTLGDRGWNIKSTNPNGQAVTRTTDALGRTTSVSGDTPAQTWGYFLDGSLSHTIEASSLPTNYDYTLRGQLKSTTSTAPETGGPRPVTQYTYFADGQINSVIDPLLRTTTYAYLPSGRIGSVTQPDPDGSGPMQASITSYQYDSIGNLRRETDGLNNATDHQYDSLFRRTSTTDPKLAVTRTGYNLFDEVTSITDPLNNITVYVYNNVGQVVTDRKVVSGANRDRTYSYDGAGNLREATDRLNRQRSFAYDNLYRMTGETWRTSTTVNQIFAFNYDAIGNLESVTDSSTLGTNFQFTYDARNQLQLERQNARVNNASFVLDRDYDAEGKITRTAANLGGSIIPGALNSGGTISGGVNDVVNSYQYDNLDRLSSVSQVGVSGGNAVAPKHASFTYNVASQMTDLRRYSSPTVSAAALEVHSRYAYDGAARIASITHAKSEIAAGENWNGTSTLPASITPAQSIAAYHFGYDRDDRLTAMASYTDRFRTVFTYDTTDQLATATSSAIAGLAAPSPLPTAESYNVDPNGNRRTSSGVSQSASGTHNQLQSDGTFNYTYDNEGNTLTKTRIATGAVTEYVWDHRNRLVGVLEKASATAAVNRRTTYAYDVFDRKTLDRLDSDGIGGINQEDLWVNDGEHPILQYRDSDGVGAAQPYRLANRYLHGEVVDQVLADEQYASGTGPVLSGVVVSTTPGTTLWTVADHLGSVRDLVDNNGITRQHVVYDSFGRRLSEVDRNAAGTVIASTNAAAIDTIFGYTGREWDKDTSLQYNRARWYDPMTARWLSQDPIGFEAGDANLYRYVKNSPTTKNDPSGHYGVGGHFFTVYSVGIAAGLTKKEAYSIAYYSQLPDQDARFEAISNSDALGASARNRAKLTYDCIHSLNGLRGDAIANRRTMISAQIKKELAGIALPKHPTQSDFFQYWRAGFLVHALGDSFSHTFINAIGELEAYDWRWGHGVQGKVPDVIANYPDKYREYVSTLYVVLGGKGNAFDNVLIKKLLEHTDGMETSMAWGTVTNGESYSMYLFARHDAGYCDPFSSSQIPYVPKDEFNQDFMMTSPNLLTYFDFLNELKLVYAQ
jgi:RHS repeat-associated protein